MRDLAGIGGIGGKLYVFDLLPKRSCSRKGKKKKKKANRNQTAPASTQRAPPPIPVAADVYSSSIFRR
jgi:hypothetical protein